MRREVAIVGLILAAAVALRVAFPSRMAVEHFDEGVYAANQWFVDHGEPGYPFRHLYAPPLFPALLGWCTWLFGPTPLGTMLVSVLAGSATVLLIWWVARRWFGPESGIAASVLAACSDFHILYSRTALTDVLLCFWLLLAVYLTWEAFRTGRISWAVAAGFATGLAWWTKYNGWLPLAIGLAALIEAVKLSWVTFPTCLFSLRSQARWKRAPRFLHSLIAWTASRRLGRGRNAADEILKPYLMWLVIAATAFTVWAPVLFSLPGNGYADVAANHRQYVVGLSGWPEAFWRQVASHRHFNGMLSIASVGLAFFTAAAVRGRGRCFTWNMPKPPNDNAARAASRNLTVDTNRNLEATGSTPLPWLTLIFVIAGLSVAAAMIGTSPVLGVLAVLGIAGSLAARSKSAENDRAARLAGWLLAAWFIGLCLATPLYRPYPRLTLPWLVAAWLGAGAATRWVLTFAEQCGQLEAHRKPGTLALRVVHLILCVGTLHLAWLFCVGRSAIHGRQPRNGMVVIAQEIIAHISQRPAVAAEKRDQQLPDNIAFVYAEPALVFHLNAAAQQDPNLSLAAVPVADFRFQNYSTRQYLIVSPTAPRNRGVSEELGRNPEARFELLEKYRYLPSDLVLLDDFHPHSPERDVEQEIWLYRVK